MSELMSEVMSVLQIARLASRLYNMYARLERRRNRTSLVCCTWPLYCRCALWCTARLPPWSDHFVCGLL